MTSALFEAWRGRYADSPRSVSAYLAATRPDVLQTWVGDGQARFPLTARAVRRHSARYFLDLATTDLLVSNDIISQHRVPGPRTTHVQCWHGTPLKAIGYDETGSKYSGAAKHLQRMERDVATWDFLVSSSPFCTTVFRRAFGYEGPVLETGLPRNDVLSQDGSGSVRARVRRHLGLADDVTAVLYVPTWRDDSKDADGRFVQPDMPDFARLRGALGEQVVFLRRLHKNVRADRLAPVDGVLDVSAYPEVSDLYLASDLLVSDYSSAIYDYAVTRRPMVCHVPDLEHYADDLRPLYFDYHEWAPGPVTRTDDELVDALRGARPGAVCTDARYEDFRTTFCPWDDGGATRRLVEAVLPRLA